MNVITVIADDLGWGDLGAFGNPLAQTPHLDRLAAGSVVFEQHYSASPMCAPARAGFLTGRFPHRTGAVDVPSNRGLDRIAPSEVTLADAFRAAGYATGMVGKWHNGAHDRRYHPRARGFDEVAGFLNGGMDYWDWVLDRGDTSEPADGRYLTDVFTEEAVRFVEAHRDRPFFLYLAYNAPHAPLQAPEADLEAFDGVDLNPAVRTLYAMVRRVDAGLGRLLSAVDALGLTDDTVVLVTSDNGPWLGSDRVADADGTVQSWPMARFNGPFAGGKQDVLEGGIRVPAILRVPGLHGARCRRAVHFCDWWPTLLGLAGVRRPGGPPVDGRDLSTHLTGRDDAGAPLAWQWNRYRPAARCNGALRDGPWKLVWPWLDPARRKEPADNDPYVAGLTSAHRLMEVDATLPDRALPPPGAPRLYHLDDDPGESTDLAAQHPLRVARMVRRWDDWFADVSADWEVARARVV